MTLFTISGVQPIRVIAAGDGPGVLVNRDEVNIAFTSTEQGFSSNDVTASIHDPLVGIPYDGQEDVYATTLPGVSLTMDFIANALNWTPSPAQAAQQIALLGGISPADNPQLLAVTLGGSVPAGGTFTSSRIPIGQFNSWFGTSFALATSAGTGTTPYYRITFNYSMAVDNYDPLEVADWVAPITPYNFVYVYRNDMSSPCWGDTLTVVVTNYDTEPMNWTYSVFGSYRTRIREKLRGRYNNVSVGESAGLGSDNILANFEASVPAGTTSSPFLCDLWDGEADLSLYSNYPGLDIAEAQFSPQPSSILSPITAFTFPHGGVGGYAYYENIALSRRVNLMTLTNRHPTQNLFIRGLLIAKGVNE